LDGSHDASRQNSKLDLYSKGYFEGKKVSSRIAATGNVEIGIRPLMLSQMKDQFVEEAQPLTLEQHTRNSPQGKVLLRDYQSQDVGICLGGSHGHDIWTCLS